MGGPGAWEQQPLGGAEGSVRGVVGWIGLGWGLPSTPHQPVHNPHTCGSAGAGVGAGLLQAVDEPIRLQLQVFHQLPAEGISRTPSPCLAMCPPLADPRVLGWPTYLPERVKLGAFWNAVFACLVLADEVVVHGFPVD